MKADLPSIQDDRQVVRALLNESELPASEREVTGLAVARPVLRVALAALHAHFRDAAGWDIDPISCPQPGRRVTSWREHLD